MQSVYCRGGTKQHLNIVLSHGWVYGLRSDYKAYHDDVYLLDIPFKRGRSAWAQHEQRALELRPNIAMIPDWETDIHLSELMPIHERLRAQGIKTLWTPKQDNIAHMIPMNSIIGISTPTPEYAGFLPAPEDVNGRDLHILGGEPDAIRYLIERIYTGANIVSFDTSSFVRMAIQYGRYWDDKTGYWIQTSKQQYSNETLIEMSAQNIIKYMRKKRAHYDMTRAPIQRIHEALTPQMKLVI